MKLDAGRHSPIDRQATTIRLCIFLTDLQSRDMASALETKDAHLSEMLMRHCRDRAAGIASMLRDLEADVS
jgi:hypothetical protein